jgi:hypothetical protein
VQRDASLVRHVRDGQTAFALTCRFVSEPRRMVREISVVV